MKKLLEFKTDDGSEFYVEVDDAAGETVRGGTAEASRSIIQNAATSFDKALKPLKEVSNSIISSIREFVDAPDEVQVELGLKFTAKAGIILTSFDSEANLKVVLKWVKKKG